MHALRIGMITNTHASDTRKAFEKLITLTLRIMLKVIWGFQTTVFEEIGEDVTIVKYSRKESY